MTSATDADEATEEVIIATGDEVYGWYMYDFANSPYFQVYVVCFMPIMLKKLAEGYAGGFDSDTSLVLPPMNTSSNATNSTSEELRIPELGITAGSYPSLVGLVTTLIQMVCLLTFSAFGDYGSKRKQLLVVGSYVACFFLFLNIFCCSSSMWWFAGVIRIFAGILFVMCMVFYNAYLPVLADVHEDVIGLPSQERADKVIELTDEMSNKGMILGYVGGLLLLVISFVMLKFFECDPNQGPCSEFSYLFWPALCMSLVGVWWALFSTYSFLKLQSRSGLPFPEGNLFCLGWKDTCDTLCMVMGYRNTLLFLLVFFVSSDSLSTLTEVAVLITDDELDASFSSIAFMCCLAALGALVGGFIFQCIQQLTGCSAKNIMISQLCAYGLVAIAGGCGAVTATGYSYYLMMAPAMLMIGSLQAYTRSIYALLIPPGSESAMFAFFEITDKGSNFMGRLVVILVHNWFGSYVPVFWYLLLGFVVSALILCCVDVEQGMKDIGKIEGGEEYQVDDEYE